MRHECVWCQGMDKTEAAALCKKIAGWPSSVLLKYSPTRRQKYPHSPLPASVADKSARPQTPTSWLSQLGLQVKEAPAIATTPSSHRHRILLLCLARFPRIPFCLCAGVCGGAEYVGGGQQGRPAFGGRRRSCGGGEREQSIDQCGLRAQISLRQSFWSRICPRGCSGEASVPVSMQHTPLPTIAPVSTSSGRRCS